MQDQIAALTKHLFEQHQAQKAPYEEKTTLLIHTLGNAVVEEIVATPTYSRPLAPGVHPVMAPRFIPGVVATQSHVRTKAEALAAVERMYGDEPVFKREQLGTWPDGEDDVPSIEESVQRKKFLRKLEP